MKYEIERNEGVPCDRRDCYNWDDEYEGWCHAESSAGDLGPSYCPAYRPWIESPDEKSMIIGRTQACKFFAQLEDDFRGLADVNRKFGQKRAADAFDECARMLKFKIDDFVNTK